jgi:hypothetical protein
LHLIDFLADKFSLVRIKLNIEMSKYLIKTIHSIAYNPINIIGELKRDLLLYDAVGMLTIDRIFKELAPLEHNHHIKNLFNELEFLIQNDKFIQLQRLFIEGDLNLSDNDNEIGAALNETKDKLINLKDEKEIRKLVILHEELSTRFWCIVANVTNENIQAIPSLQSTTSLTLPNTTQEKAMQIVHKMLPLPNDQTPWEKIFDFNSDEESKNSLLRLRNWINDLSPDLKQFEILDKIQYLHSEYAKNLKRHKIETRLTTIKTIVKVIPSALTEIVRFKFDKSVDAFFSVSEQLVNFQNYKTRNELIGNEIAYINQVNEKFK